MQNLTPEQLEKGLRALESAAQNPAVVRKNELLAMAQAGDNLTKAETEELTKALNGDSDFKQEVLAPLEPNDTLTKAFDASDFLADQHTALTKSLGAIAENITKSDDKEHAFRVALAQTMSGMGSMLKSLVERVDNLAAQPAGAPRALGATPANDAAIVKSIAGQNAAPQGAPDMHKSEALALLQNMAEDESWGPKHLSRGGSDISAAITGFEMDNQIDDSLYAELQQYRAHRNG